MAISVIAGDTLVIVVDSKSKKSFAQMIQRAVNTWPDAPAEIKEFADLVTVGYVQQDYKSQDTSKALEVSSEVHIVTLAGYYKIDGEWRYKIPGQSIKLAAGQTLIEFKEIEKQ